MWIYTLPSGPFTRLTFAGTLEIPGKVEYLHPLLEPALQETLGVILFQEQVLKIARDVAGSAGGAGTNGIRCCSRIRALKRVAGLLCGSRT